MARASRSALNRPGRLRFDGALDAPLAGARRNEQERRDDRNGKAGSPGTTASKQHEHARHPERLRLSEDLLRELGAERRVGFLARDARHEHAGRRGDDERRDLRDQAVADA